MLRIEQNTSGPRLYIRGRRVHHGAIALAALLVLKDKRARMIAMAAYVHDARDLPFRDCDNRH